MSYDKVREGYCLIDAKNKKVHYKNEQIMRPRALGRVPTVCQTHKEVLEQDIS